MGERRGGRRMRGGSGADGMDVGGKLCSNSRASVQRKRQDQKRSTSLEKGKGGYTVLSECTEMDLSAATQKRARAQSEDEQSRPSKRTTNLITIQTEYESAENLHPSDY